MFRSIAGSLRTDRREAKRVAILYSLSPAQTEPATSFRRVYGYWEEWKKASSRQRQMKSTRHLSQPKVICESYLMVPTTRDFNRSRLMASA
jgi:hypothetical protein